MSDNLVYPVLKPKFPLHCKRPHGWREGSFKPPLCPSVVGIVGIRPTSVVPSYICPKISTGFRESASFWANFRWIWPAIPANLAPMSTSMSASLSSPRPKQRWIGSRGATLYLSFSRLERTRRANESELVRGRGNEGSELGGDLPEGVGCTGCWSSLVRLTALSKTSIQSCPCASWGR
jgi:hypothetical protein